jgi:hypothetical protein
MVCRCRWRGSKDSNLTAPPFARHERVQAKYLFLIRGPRKGADLCDLMDRLERDIV